MQYDSGHSWGLANGMDRDDFAAEQLRSTAMGISDEEEEDFEGSDCESHNYDVQPPLLPSDLVRNESALGSKKGLQPALSTESSSNVLATTSSTSLSRASMMGEKEKQKDTRVQAPSVRRINVEQAADYFGGHGGSSVIVPAMSDLTSSLFGCRSEDFP